MKKTILYIVLATLCLFFKVQAQTTVSQNTKIITGKITDEQGQSLPGATIKIKEKPDIVVTTDPSGNYSINQAPVTGTIVISFISYQTAEIKYSSTSTFPLFVQLKPDINSLNEVQVIGYGTTTKRLNTGSVSTISAADIEKQPVTNVLSALSGRVPGVFVQTSNGLPGGNINIQIRGKGSIAAGTNPLYVIDGVPFNSTIGALTSLSTLSNSAINGVVSPLNNINPEDIESISVLKDADATAIYGSRGSNGVVLITTKQGKSGKTKVDINFSQGVNKATNLPKLLNLNQYLQIRREAYANDGLVPSNDPNSNDYAPDLTVWNSQPTTDWGKYLLGGTGHVTNLQSTFSGGNGNTNFTTGINYHSEKTYLPGDNLYYRGGMYANIQHHSENNKFYLQFSNSLSLDNNTLVNPSASVASDILLAPNYPIYDNTGNYNWYAGQNPAAEINATSKSQANNVISNILLRYEIVKNLGIKISAGYNRISIDQTQIFPSVALYPGSVNYTNFGKNSNQTFIVEPQVDYAYHFRSSTLNLLAGGTYQNTLSQGESIKASNFSSVTLMQNISSASTFVPSNTYTQYKYASLFGRATYNIGDRYIINASIRQDASSRFGPGNRIGTFGAVGAAWLWSEEDFVKKNLGFISFGKFRSSYGLTGNDQITDYQYLSTYSSSGYIYQTISGLKPARIANSDFHWETTKKLELAVELGFFKNRILLNVNRYQSLSKDQLVAYSIPSLSGFTSYQANLPAVVENSGWELELNTKNIAGQSFSWSTNFNITVPKNKLNSFENLATSSYANSLVIGEDITRVYGYQFTGLDNSGLAQYATKNGGSTNSPNSQTDSYYTIGKQTPDFYGGLGNTITYKSWSLDVFGQFAKQKSLGNLVYVPGAQAYNNYAIVLNRWTTPGQLTTIPKSSTFNDYNYYQSNANYFDASYFRLKNVAINYSLPKNWIKKTGLDRARLFIQGQNLLTFWHSNNPLIDPESGTFSSTSKNLPPVKSIVVGIQTTF